MVIGRIGSRIIRFKRISSTNDRLKRLAPKLAHGTVMVAETQTKGRGTKTRKWVSERGGLYFSILLKPKQMKHLDYLNHVTTLSVVHAVRHLCEARIKAPNDVYLNGKKLCGVLLESRSTQGMDYVVVGIGVNVNQTRFPGYLKATSLRMECGREFDMDDILKRVLKSFSTYYAKLEKGKVKELDKEFRMRKI
jgi:BirA family biotin operon repressor/biotin-[acetyl-CoA-carboxylase] ligase